MEEIDRDVEEIVALERFAQTSLLRRRRCRVIVPVHEGAGPLWILDRRGQIHMADGPRPLAGELRHGHGVHVDAAPARAVHVKEPRARLAHIAGEGDQRRQGAEDVAALRLALHALSEPEQRRTGRIGGGRRLDQIGRHAAEFGGDRGRHGVDRRFELLRAQHVLSDEVPID